MNGVEGIGRMSDLRELFQEYKGQRVALYGLGTETEKALAQFGDFFEIIGLLDGFRDSGTLYGKEIMPLCRVVKEKAALIIVVARPGSCKAIARRIGDVCRQEKIALLDIRGRDLLESKKVTYDFSMTEGRKKEELFRKIDQADVISFDLFDTLVMRDVLYYTDVFEMTEARLGERGVVIPGFASRRLAAEKELAKSGAPTLATIYKRVLGEIKDSPVSTEELAVLEWEIDRNTIVPRRAVCEVFAHCIRQGKAVYIITDTYYRRQQIEEILDKCGLAGQKGVLVSCEYGRGKTQGLFENLKLFEGDKRYLHLGDDTVADLETAENAGMDSFYIISGRDLLDALGYMGLEDCGGTLPERIKTGMMVSRLFNDPFRFEKESREIVLQSAYEIGYLVCAPVVTDFMLWFRERVRQEKIPNVWFSARDGYLPKKLYQMLDEKPTVYFMTSRIAAVEAGMEDEADIAYVDSMKFSGTLEENLRVRFGLRPDRIQVSEKDGQGLARYREAILSNAEIQRERYRAYIESLQVKDGAVAFFDFVAKGTTQMYIQKLLPNPLKGLYFLRLEPEFMSDKRVSVEAFYGTDETQGSAVFDNYYVLETILTAPHPSVNGFDNAGQPTFAQETRNRRDIECFVRAQEGIADYFRRYLELVPPNARGQTKKLDEIMLGLIHRLRVTDSDFLSLVVEDPFFNRTTNMTDLI